MDRYVITYWEPADGTYGTSRMDAETQGEAVKNFRKVYSVSQFKIVSVGLEYDPSLTDGEKKSLRSVYDVLDSMRKNPDKSEALLQCMELNSWKEMFNDLALMFKNEGGEQRDD